jgi:hypothetical protein
MIPCGFHGFCLDTTFESFFSFEQIYGHMAQDFKIFRSMILSKTAVIFVERYIQTPMVVE